LLNFRLITGGKDDGPEQILCLVCERETGIATSHFIESVIAPMKYSGKIKGGTKILACIECLARGKITVYRGH